MHAASRQSCVKLTENLYHSKEYLWDLAYLFAAIATTSEAGT